MFESKALIGGKRQKITQVWSQILEKLSTDIACFHYPGLCLVNFSFRLLGGMKSRQEVVPYLNEKHESVSQ